MRFQPALPGPGTPGHLLLGASDLPKLHIDGTHERLSQEMGSWLHIMYITRKGICNMLFIF